MNYPYLYHENPQQEQKSCEEKTKEVTRCGPYTIIEDPPWNLDNDNPIFFFMRVRIRETWEFYPVNHQYYVRPPLLLREVLCYALYLSAVPRHDRPQVVICFTAVMPFVLDSENKCWMWIIGHKKIDVHFCVCLMLVLVFFLIIKHKS